MIFINPVFREQEEKERAKRFKEMLAREAEQGGCEKCHRQIALSGGPGRFNSKLCTFCDRAKRYFLIQNNLELVDKILDSGKINKILETIYAKDLFNDPAIQWVVCEEIKRLDTNLSLIPVKLVFYYFESKKLNHQINIKRVEEIIKEACHIK